jgi:hypothetical protein
LVDKGSNLSLAGSLYQMNMNRLKILIWEVQFDGF